MPSTTIDWTISDGIRSIPIEERDPSEVTDIYGQAGDKLCTVTTLASKTADPRWRWYRDTTGLNRCWELDALSPVVLRERLEQAIVDEIEPEAWERVKLCEQAEQASLANILGKWQRIVTQETISRLAHE